MNVATDSTSTYTNSAYSSAGFSGMASGIDTESLVKSMLSGIQTKIDKQNQQKQQLLWKQEMYRDVITKINNFQSKYLDLTSNTSLRTNAFFNKMTSTSSSSAVNILSASSGADTEMSVQVAQLASATQITSQKFSSGDIDMDVSSISQNLSDYFSKPTQDITFTVGSGEQAKTVSVNLCDIQGTDGGTPTVEQLTDEINKQLSDNNMDIKLTVGTDSKITVESQSSDPQEFTLSGSSNALETLGLRAMKFSDDNEYKYESTTSADVSKLSDSAPTEANFTMTLDGKSADIKITNGTADEVMSSFKKQVKSAFGSSVSVDEQTGKITARKGQTLSISGDSSVIGVKSGSCTRLTTSSKLSELGIDDYKFTVNGKEFEFDADTKVSDVISKVNSSDAGVKMVYNSLNDTFSLTSNSTGEGYDIDISGGVADKFFGSYTVKEGKNAIVNINGTTVEKTSNTFTANGITMELKSTTGNYGEDPAVDADGKFVTADGSKDEAAEITASRDTTKIVDTIKSFVEDYNTLISDLNELTHASKTYTKYDPLTDEQKKEMKDSEIEAWEKKAHEGLLSGDSDISTFLQSMRTALYSKADNGFSLSMFGIDSSSDWKDYGKLEIDEDKLTTALKDSTEGNDLVNAFTNIATKLNTACKSAANTSLVSPGSLVTIAGVKGKVSENSNNIKSQLDSIADKLEKLQNQYDQRKTRYWNQFNSMETALSNMNTTSNYLTQMLGG